MFIKRKKALKNLVQGPDVQTFWLLSHSPGYGLMLCHVHIQISLKKIVKFTKDKTKFWQKNAIKF